MSSLWVLVMVVVVLAVALKLFSDSKLFSRDEEEKLPYRLQPYFLNRSEMAFFHELKKALPDGYHVFSKVRIIDFVQPTDKSNYAKWRNKIWAKHVDFLVCDQGTKPVLAIEVDGKSHNSTKRMERDDFIDKVFSDIGMRLQRVSVGSNFSHQITSITDNLRS